MQNPRITELESKFKHKIIRVMGFENLVNVVVLTLEEIEEKMGLPYYQPYECKGASKARFVLFSSESGLPNLASEEIPIQVPDPT